MKTKPKLKHKAKPKRNGLEPVVIPETWTDDQAIAVYDFCEALHELIWRRYHEALIDPMLQKQFKVNGAQHIDNRTYPLPFDDAPPF